MAYRMLPCVVSSKKLQLESVGGLRERSSAERRTKVGYLRVSTGISESVLAGVRMYIHSSAQSHCTPMFHDVGSPPDNAVDGKG
eukprot:9482260-Pyramimonas_sp.AAC.1